ncbi:uncharacterized protein LOC134705506 [Mytilus trossulus]|uniref:uncharacterized protein LOC134705506 n=1 Tax=Mytilus trossulus TaxID=6551 RepID=UPI003005C04F
MADMQKLIAYMGTITVDTVSVPTFVPPQGRKLSLIHSFQTSKLGDGVKIKRGCFIPGDRLLLGEYDDGKLYVCKLDGSQTKLINLDYKPERMSLYDNNRALVSVHNEGIQIIDLTACKPGRKIKVEGICYGITSVNDTIWTNNKAKTLTLVDINGKVLNTIHTTCNPWDICANKEGDIYCTDIDSNKVYVVTSDGTEREIYSSPHLIDPFGVAVDDLGDVYVAGSESDTIHRISSDGRKSGIVLTANDGVIDPTGLSYNNETKELFVINNCSYINIYKAQEQ